MSDPIRQLCTILLEKAQSQTGENLSNIISEVLKELDSNAALSQSLRQDSRMLQINMGQSKGYQVLVEANATAYIGDQYHFEAEVVIKALGQLLDEFSKKQPIVGIPNNLPLSGAISFIGRDSKLKDLDQQLQSNYRIAITAIAGMGGIGKTELALQYAMSQLGQGQYPAGLCWLRARGQEIATQIVSFAKANLGLTIPDDMEASEQVRFVWQRWPEGTSLIVVDDVTDYEAIQLYLPPSDSRFKVLITTRQHFGVSVTSINLEELSDEDAIALLKSIIGEKRVETKRSDAQALCKWVGNLPLGLELLGRFLVGKPDWSISKLLERLESHRLAAKALIETERGMTATLGVAAALELSWAELAEPERDLACLLGMFAVAPVPWSFVESCFPGVDLDELEERRDEGLGDRSLIKRVGEGTYQLHQVVQQFLRYQFNQSSNKHRFEFLVTKLCETIASFSRNLLNTNNLDGTIGYLPIEIAHLKEVANHWHDFLEDKNLTIVYLYIGKYYEVQSILSEAAKWYQKGLEITQNRLGTDHFDIGTIWNNLGKIYESQGLYQSAEDSWKNALKISRKFGRYTDSNVVEEDIAIILNNLGTLYSRLGYYNKAELFLKTSLKIRQNLFEDSHLDVNQSLNNLACLRIYQERFIEAENILISLFKTDNYSNNVEKITNLNNLALAYQKQHKLSEANKCFTQALDVLNSNDYLENHLIKASLYINFASLCILTKNYKKAEFFLLTSKNISEINLEKKHPNIATIYNLLGECKFVQGKNNEAERFLLESLSIRQEKLCPDHPDLIKSYLNLSNFYYLNGNSIRGSFYQSKYESCK